MKGHENMVKTPLNVAPILLVESLFFLCSSMEIYTLPDFFFFFFCMNSHNYPAGNSLDQFPLAMLRDALFMLLEHCSDPSDPKKMDVYCSE